MPALPEKNSVKKTISHNVVYKRYLLSKTSPRSWVPSSINQVWFLLVWTWNSKGISKDPPKPWRLRLFSLKRTFSETGRRRYRKKLVNQSYYYNDRYGSIIGESHVRFLEEFMNKKEKDLTTLANRNPTFVAGKSEPKLSTEQNVLQYITRRKAMRMDFNSAGNEEFLLFLMVRHSSRHPNQSFQWFGFI